MNSLLSKSRNWLSSDVFPLWLAKGIDAHNGSFVECLSRSGEPMPAPRRAMVQARQIYSFAEAARMGILARAQAQSIIDRAAQFFVSSYSLANGGFAYSVTPDGAQVNSHPDLYTQAFALFGLAEAFHITENPRLKSRALQLVDYLKRDRRLPSQGYSELSGDKIAHEANPHMHLFEAAIAWMKVDKDGVWHELAAEIDGMARAKFIDSETGALCEHFENNWVPQRENGNFVWEPGHHCEWAWLMTQYLETAKLVVDSVPFAVFQIAEEAGRGKSGMVYDEVWSGGKVKKQSARFWPQGERVKAAVALGVHAPQAQRAAFGKAADQALEHLFTYFEGHKPGLWGDVRSAEGVLEMNDSVKASSLYHIINAMSEYARLREKL